MSLLDCQSQGLSVPRQFWDEIATLLPTKPGPTTRNYMVQLSCPGANSLQMNRSKWALVFASEQDLNQFILEVDSSQDKQFRLSIEEYTVFSNVMFAFLRRQYKLTSWVQHVRELIRYQPLGIFLFNERFRQLVELVEANIFVYYEIDWRYEMVPRRYNRKNAEPESSNYLSQHKPKQKRSRYNLRPSPSAKVQYDMEIGEEPRKQPADSQLLLDQFSRPKMEKIPEFYPSEGMPFIQSRQPLKSDSEQQGLVASSTPAIHDWGENRMPLNDSSDQFRHLKEFSMRMMEKIQRLNEFFGVFMGAIAEQERNDGQL